MTDYRRRRRGPHPPRGAAGPQRHQPRRHDPLGQRADRRRRLADHVGGTRGGGDLAAMSGALVVNIGTLTRDWIEGAHAAVAGARRAGPPVDPRPGRRRRHARSAARPPRRWWRRPRASSAATPRRSWRWPEARPAARVSTAPPARRPPLVAARGWRAATGAVVAVTGAVDLVTDGSGLARVANGDALLTRTTASGCASTALIGAWAADLRPAGGHGRGARRLRRGGRARRRQGRGLRQLRRRRCSTRWASLDGATAARLARIT